MTDQNSPQWPHVPLEGGGAWVPAPPAEDASAGPEWPAPATAPPSDAPAWVPPSAAPPAAAAEGGGWIPPTGPGSPAWGAGWSPPPPSGPPPGGGSWGVDEAGNPATSTPPAQPHRHRLVRGAAAATMVAAAAAAGIGLGHVAWPQRASAVSAPPTSGSGNSGSPGLFDPNGSSGQSPFGSGDSPFGSGGSSGESPFNFGSGGSSGGGVSSSGSTSETDAIAAKVSPALVDINSTFGYQNTQGAGTGIVLTSNGEVVTNNHVINGATKITATDVGNGQTYTATVVGYDASHDIAVLQLKGASGLKTAHLGNSSKVAVGESVVAVGNAGGTGGTPSNAGGSVTALNQSITAGDDLDGVSEHLSGLIQVNADIQPGDSGGSLVNTAGQVIGIDTAASQGFSFQTSSNQGFAIPINEAVTIAHQILSGHGTATTHVGGTAFLGVELSTSSSSGNSGSFSGNGSGSGSGALVSGVVSGGPAAQAGLTAGDTITSVDGTSVDSPESISAVMVGHHPGDRIQISWVDSSGQSHTATVDLGSGPPA